MASLIQYRGGIAWFPSIDALVKEQASIKVGALSVTWGEPRPPSLRQTIDFNVMVEGWRCGPLRADVVHVAGENVGLHLSPDAIVTLQQLLTQIENEAAKKQSEPDAEEAAAETAEAEAETAEAETETAEAEAETAEAEAETAEAETAAEKAEASAAVAAAAGPATRRRRSTGGILPGTSIYQAVPKTGAHAAVSGETVKPFHGKLAGELGLGVLGEFFDESDAVEPPPLASLFQVLRWLHQLEATGRLLLRSPQYTKTVWVKQGTVLKVAVSPVKEDEMLGQILLHAKWVSPQDLGDALRWAENDKVGLGTALVKAGKLDPNRLHRALGHQTYRRLRDLFEWAGAEFAFEESAMPPPPYHPVAVPRLMKELALDLLREAKLDDLNVLLDPVAHRYPLLADMPADRFKELIPDDKGQGVFRKIFDGKRPLRQAIPASILGRPRTVQLTLYLLAADAVELHLDPVDSELKVKVLLQERLRAIEVQNNFQRLCLGYAAHASELRPAYEHCAAEFAEGTRFHQADAKAAEKAVKLFDEASMVLSTAASRKKYRQKLLGPQKLSFLASLVRQEAELAEVHGQVKRARRLQETLTELT